MTQGGVQMLREGTYLADDGDAIPGVSNHVGGLASIAFAMIGRCPHCESEHWYMQVLVHEAGELAVQGLAEEEPEWERSWTTEHRMQDGRSALWSTHTYRTADGPGYAFQVGPMLTPGAGVPRGPSGVSACGGGVFWRHAASTMAAAEPHLIAALQAMRGEHSPAVVQG